MTVNSNNFEAYMLDYLEGNLDPLLTADLMAFLAENPEFEKYLPDYDSSLSLSDTHEYAQKNELKRGFADLPEITSGNFDEFCIAACEGLLDEKDINRLSDFIAQHSDKQHDFDLYRKVKLQPDTDLQYTGKALLKKNHRPLPLRYLYYAMGLAASIALLLMLVFRKPAESNFTVTLPVNSSQSENSVPQTEPLPAPIRRSRDATPAPLKELEPKVIAASNAVSLTPLQPISDVQIPSPINPPRITYHLVSAARNNQEQNPSRPYSSDSFANTYLGSLLRRVNFWKTAETAITGFNYLTESQLSVGRTTDDSGKLTGLLIEMESYSITGNKIK
jgi:hypothetical protein